MTRWFELVTTGSWVLTLAIALILIIRPMVRRLWGSIPVYALWLIPLFVVCVVLFAPRSEGPRLLSRAEFMQNQQIGYVDIAAGTGVAFVIWLLGFGVAVAVVFMRQYKFETQLGETILFDVIRNVPILKSATTLTPMALGILNWRIVVPDDFEHMYPMEMRKLIISHELVHLRRRDPFANVLAEMVRCLFWFHPLVYWGIHYYRIDQEASCDEMVLRSSPDSRAIYGEALLKVASSHTHITNSWRKSKHEVERRIVMLILPIKSRAIRIRGLMVVTVLALLAGVGANGLVPPKSPRMLSVGTHDFLLEQLPEEELGQNLLKAVTEGDLSLTRRLLRLGAPTEYAQPSIGTALILAAKIGRYDLVELLVEGKADVNASVLSAGSPLIMAAKFNRQKIAQLLIEHGSDVNEHVFLDETPLINAARFGHLELVKTLIEAGALVDKSVTTFSITHLPLGTKSPLSEARRIGHADVVSLLKSNGA
ncbi:MAG: hypothetical protein GXP16_08475 [Gammaproteobacteria bacterium]|nr:hypothetical protein [Gammaproteobacteria bacterium]